jgi:cytochrome c
MYPFTQSVFMKKYMLILLVAAIAGCQTHEKSGPNSIAGNPYINRGTSASDTAATGQQLIGAYDCSSCHSLNAKNTGPSFMAIAKRYPNGLGVAENLTVSIRKGSIGVWGTVHAMPAHTNVTYQNALKITQYILSLKDLTSVDSANLVK